MKIPYFKIGEAFQEAKDSFSYGSNTDKVSSTAKLLGKSVANIGLLAVEIGVDAVKRVPEHMGKVAQENLDKRSHLMTEEQVAKAHEVIEKANQAKAQRLEKEREADQQERHRE